MTRYKKYNPNPCQCRVGDCVIRAICKATGKRWETVYVILCSFGFYSQDMPNANHVWGRYLKELGYKRHLIEDYGYDYTVADFCRDHPKGTYILAIDGHVVCAVDGFYYDSWDSGQELPIYYWTRGD